MSNKDKKASKKESRPPRGGVWTTWLVLMMIHGVGAVLLANSTLQQQYANNRNLILTSLAVAAVLQIVSVIGLWNWKLWGLYMFVAVVFIQMAAHMVLTASVYVGFYDAIPLLITGYLINANQKIKHFT
jgi:uncharacterized membrane protein (DUF2068 family)